MHPAATARGPDLEPSAIDLDDGQRRDVGHLGLQRPRGAARRLGVAVLAQFGADLLGDPSDMRTAEGDLGQLLEPRGGQRERGLSSPGGHDLLEDGRAGARGIKVECATAREKIPAAGRERTHGLVVMDGRPADDQVARFGPHGTVPPAVRTGLDRAEALGIVSEQLREVPRVSACAASTALCSKVLKSTSSGGPASPKARRAMTFPSPRPGHTVPRFASVESFGRSSHVLAETWGNRENGKLLLTS